MTFYTFRNALIYYRTERIFHESKNVYFTLVTEQLKHYNLFYYKVSIN
jgi:hypothetical protein